MKLVTLRTRKPVDRITATDLRAFPMWEFAADEEDRPEMDETWVRPVKGKSMPPDASTLLVAADFTTKSGLCCTGFMTITTLGEVEVTPGALLIRREYVFIPDGPFPAKTRRALARKLGSTELRVFPIKWKLRVPLKGKKELLEGLLE